MHSRLFSSLDSTWRFRPGSTPNTTVIDFSVEFEVKNLLAAQAMDVFFDEVALQQASRLRAGVGGGGVVVVWPNVWRGQDSVVGVGVDVGGGGGSGGDVVLLLLLLPLL